MSARTAIFALCIWGVARTLNADLETAFTFDYDAPDQTSAAAVIAAKRAGSEQASRDIAANRFYIIEYGQPVDEPTFPVVPRDDATGYAILSLHNCVATPAFEAQAKAYNDTMRTWHREHLPKTSNHAMERTTGSFGPSSSMKFHPQPAATRCPASRRSSCSR